MTHVFGMHFNTNGNIRGRRIFALTGYNVPEIVQKE